MFSLILHYIIYGLFDSYFFCAYWFFRITYIDRLVENKSLQFAEKAKINVVLNYKSKEQKEKNGFETNDNLKNGHERNGESKWPTITVYDRRVWAKLAAYPTLGLAEGFIDEWIDADGESLSGFWSRLIEKRYDLLLAKWHLLYRFWNWLLFECVNNQTKAGVKKLMKVHYDFGNDVFERLIGPTMQYSCGYWRDAANLEEAQMNKMELIGRKLKLRPGMRVLDIGCGWGSLANHLSIKYDVHVVAVTPSAEGVKYIKDKFKDNNKLEVVCADYRDMQHLGKFDRIVSVGMFEHVGHKNYRQFMDICRDRLTNDGIFLLHTIATNQSESFYPRAERYLEKYVWPCGELPFQTEVVKAIEHRFVIEDWHNFGADYWKTCDAWFQNWKTHKDYVVNKYGAKTYRCFFYWLCFTVHFHYRRWHLWQIVLTKHGLVGGYDSVR